MKATLAFGLPFVLVTILHGQSPAGSAIKAPVPASELRLECEVLSADGAPAPGAEIMVCAEVPQSLYHLENGILATGHCDAKGRYQHMLPVRPDWEYFVACAYARAPGLGTGVARLGGQLPWREASKTKIRLSSGADLKVKVLRPDGNPAKGLKVWIASFSQGEIEGTSFPFWCEPSLLPGDFWNATTDAEGSCAIHGVPAQGNVYLNHDAVEFAQPNGKHNILLDGMKAGKEVNLLTLVPAASLSGRIVKPDGTPASGVAVAIIEKTPYVTAYGAEVLSDAGGHFHLRQIPASKYDLSLSFQPPLLDEFIGPEKTSTTVKSGENVDLGDIKLTPVAIVTARVFNRETGREIEPPLTYRFAAGQHEVNYRVKRVAPEGFEPESTRSGITVNVHEGEHVQVDFKLTPLKPEDTVTGTVLGPSGAPEPKAQVMLDWGSFGDGPSITQTDGEGKFRLATSKKARSLSLYAWNEDMAMSEILSPKRGEVVTLNLKKDGFASVSGRVSDGNGKPVEGARVHWQREGLSMVVVPLSSHSTTDAEGHFSFPRLWAGRGYRFTATAKGFGTTHEDPIQLRPGEAFDKMEIVLLAPSLTLSGIVTDEGGQPVPGVEIYAYGQGQPSGLHAVTDEAGRFRFAHVSPGTVDVRAWMETGTSHASVNKSVKAGSQDVRLILRQGKGVVTGTVVDPAGKPLAGVKIWSDGSTVVSNAQGKFEMRGVAKEGWCSLQVTASDQDRGERQKFFRVKVGTNDNTLTMPDHQAVEEIRTDTDLPMVGKQAPEIKVALWYNSGPLAAKALPGKVRVLDFWGTECGPCLAGMPKVQAFWKEHRSQNLELIAITGPYPDQEIRDFLANHPDYTFPVANQPEGAHSYADYAIRGIPTYVVIDTTGKIISHGHDWAEASKAAAELLAH